MIFSHLHSRRFLSLLTLVLVFFVHSPTWSQLWHDDLALLEPDTTFNDTRVKTAMGISGVVFVSSGVGLYRTWYSQFDQSSFHLFDDSREWLQMDKAGHVFTTYFQSEMCYKSARWTGMSQRGSLLYGAACGFVLQGAVEVFDGFSDKWGFSVTDLAANTLGMAAFVAQQAVWDDQRIRFKISSRFGRDYGDVTIYDQITGDSRVVDLSVRDRALYGSNGPQRFIKDYNSQTYWISINPSRFGLEFVPQWLSIAVGYGAQGLFGGFENTWEIDGVNYLYPEQRIRQFYLAPDIDFAGIQFDNHLLTTLGTLLNAYKWPTPAIEYNRQDGWSFHLLLLHN